MLMVEESSLLAIICVELLRSEEDYQCYLWYFYVEKAVHLLSLTSSLVVKKSSFCHEFIVLKEW